MRQKYFFKVFTVYLNFIWSTCSCCPKENMLYIIYPTLLIILIIIGKNLLCWPDVFSAFSFNITHSSECSICKHKNQYETNQLYVELPVPPNKSALKEYVEDFFNETSEFGCFCDGGCKAMSVKTKWSSITTAEETKCLIVILTRGI